MADLQSLDQRVTALEQVVADLRAKVAVAPENRLDVTQWAIPDEEGVEEITRLGREFRRHGRLSDEVDDQS